MERFINGLLNVLGKALDALGYWILRLVVWINGQWMDCYALMKEDSGMFYRGWSTMYTKSIGDAKLYWKFNPAGYLTGLYIGGVVYKKVMRVSKRNMVGL